MTLTFENEQDFDLGFDPEEVAAAVINGVLDQEACPYEAEVELGRGAEGCGHLQLQHLLL